ncbi:hypothetical protein CSIM01_09339 [Colletotrichum simmondsii]|uniref:Uncharacterized protein n=1 Tax=Colletotrichum simmondsii TaxID=703756 RepID=A0A135TFU6_9PEZI|nr:hypothetical protein CSIM01_09339 [Colletotrichum simmondsii]
MEETTANTQQIGGGKRITVDNRLSHPRVESSSQESGPSRYRLCQPGARLLWQAWQAVSLGADAASPPQAIAARAKPLILPYTSTPPDHHAVWRRRRPSPVEAQTRLGRRRNLLRRGDGLCNSLGPLGAEDKAHGSVLGSSLQIASILPPRRARFPSHTSPTHQDSLPHAVSGLGSLVILVYHYCIRRKRPQHRFGKAKPCNMRSAESRETGPANTRLDLLPKALVLIFPPLVWHVWVGAARVGKKTWVKMIPRAGNLGPWLA